MNLHVKLDARSIDSAIKKLNELQKNIDMALWQTQIRLAEMARQYAEMLYNADGYYVSADGTKDVTVETSYIDKGKMLVRAYGRDVLFLEFGTGITYEKPRHPQSDQFGYGAGTYPGQTHALTGNGWTVPYVRVHTYGNPPTQAMYLAYETIRESALDILREELHNVGL